VEMVLRRGEANGRVVVTGMGKSGIIAQKIAATLSSTGSPAIFLHPAEAVHGDLGMLMPGDVVVALSASGETEEILRLLAHLKRMGDGLISFCCNLKSTLATASDVALDCSVEREACGLNLAPTASTTAMLALGDALAVALLERKGFSADDFKTFHPGGKLGRKLLHVAELMHEGDSLPLVAADCLMSEALLVMTSKRFGCVGVTDQSGRLAGIITDGDLRRHMEAGLTERGVRDVMTPRPRTIGAGVLAAEALRIMNMANNERGITVLFVVDGDRRPVGILHVHDLLRAGVV
jgi:arabinose-5-phosphate isomerase